MPQILNPVRNTLFQVLKKMYFAQSNSEEVSNGVEEKTEIVRGDSLEPLIKNGEEIKVLYGYYKCQEVKRNDIACFRLSDGRKL